MLGRHLGLAHRRKHLEASPRVPSPPSPTSSSAAGTTPVHPSASPAPCPSWRDVRGASVATRVHITGCLALYEPSGFPQVSGIQMLFKTCGTRSSGGVTSMRAGTPNATLASAITHTACSMAEAWETQLRFVNSDYRREGELPI
ncbi:unnamed protein product [Urochloa humidicola]